MLCMTHHTFVLLLFVVWSIILRTMFGHIYIYFTVVFPTRSLLALGPLCSFFRVGAGRRFSGSITDGHLSPVTT